MAIASGEEERGHLIWQGIGICWDWKGVGGEKPGVDIRDTRPSGPVVALVPSARTALAIRYHHKTNVPATRHLLITRSVKLDYLFTLDLTTNVVWEGGEWVMKVAVLEQIGFQYYRGLEGHRKLLFRSCHYFLEKKENSKIILGGQTTYCSHPILYFNSKILLNRM